MTTIVPNRRQPKVNVLSRSVPSPKGVSFLYPSAAAIAIGATIGKYRLKSITRPDGYIPRPGFRSGTRIVVEAIGHSQSIEGRAVVRGSG